MTLLSRKADYALLILLHLHQHGLQATNGSDGRACAREIADRFGIDQSFVANILKELCRKGFVTGHRGVKGGYTLLRSAATITLAELLDALEDGVRLAECNGETAADSACKLAHTCPVKGPVAQIHERIRAVLRGVTLDEIFRSGTPAGGALLHLSTVLAPAAPAAALPQALAE
jgi:Rrf2 family protein